MADSTQSCSLQGVVWHGVDTTAAVHDRLAHMSVDLHIGVEDQCAKGIVRRGRGGGHPRCRGDLSSVVVSGRGAGVVPRGGR